VSGIAIGGNDESWQSRIARSYEAWKVDFDIYSKDTLAALEPDAADKEEFQRFSTANIAIYHAAHIILNVEIIDLQIYAGANHILGRPVMKADRERSRQTIHQWAKSGSIPSALAASHGAHLLRDGARKLTNWDAGNMFHYPWCLYLATLTCWAFQVASKNGENRSGVSKSDNGEAANDEDADWDSKAEMNALISALTRSRLDDLWKVAGKYRNSDLPRVMAKHLVTVRWAVVHEGMIVLRSLVASGEVG
jgi:hypothetical protein